MFGSVETVVSVPVEGGELTLALDGAEIVVTGPGMVAQMPQESLAVFVAGAGRLVVDQFTARHHDHDV